jgi:hypothetical protein
MANDLLRCLYHNERWYEWEFPGGGECIVCHSLVVTGVAYQLVQLRDTGGSPVAMLCAVQPERCPLGTVYNELRFSSHIAMVRGTLVTLFRRSQY